MNYLRTANIAWISPLSNLLAPVTLIKPHLNPFQFIPPPTLHALYAFVVILTNT